MSRVWAWKCDTCGAVAEGDFNGYDTPPPEWKVEGVNLKAECGRCQRPKFQFRTDSDRAIILD